MTGRLDAFTSDSSRLLRGQCLGLVSCWTANHKPSRKLRCLFTQPTPPSHPIRASRPSPTHLISSLFLFPFPFPFPISFHCPFHFFPPSLPFPSGFISSIAINSLSLNRNSIITIEIASTIPSFSSPLQSCISNLLL